MLASPVHYLHVVSDWPSSKSLDKSRAYELGAPGVAHVQNGAIYFYHKTGVIERFKVDDKLTIASDGTISFSAYGIKDYDPENIWVSPDTAFLVDESTGQIIRWNPTTMLVDGVSQIRDDVLLREPNKLKAQFQLGIASEGRLFTTANWRDWDRNLVHPAASIAVFDASNPDGGPTLVEHPRCAASVAVGTWRDAEGYIYAVGDGARGYDKLVNPNRSPSSPPQCVVRMRENADEMDPGFYVDLQAVTKSPAIHMVYPMPDNKLLAAMWSPEVDVASVIDPKSDDWFWNGPYYEYAIIDLKAGTSTKVAALPRAAMQTQKSLIVDGQNYVQLFRADKGSTVHRVTTNGDVTQVLDNPSGTDVQFVGRL